MSPVIYKYPLSLVDLNHESIIEIQIQADARILSVQLQGEKPTLWAAVYPDETTVRRRIGVLGTGHSEPWMGDLPQFVGTVQLANGLVLHIFDLGIAS